MTSLEEELRAIIEAEGPMPVSRYMALCLGHPRHGYYATRDPLGVAGDFTTAPEISQMFGELVGLWCAEAWRGMRAPARVRLVELGPGRGTLMHDVLRAAKLVPAFEQALEIHLVETSPVLAALQREKLAGADVPIAWHESAAGLPAGRIWVSKRCRSTLRHSGMSMGMRWVSLFPRLVDHCDQRFWGWAITRQIEAKFLQAIVDRHSPELPQEVHPDQQCRALTQSPNIED